MLKEKLRNQFPSIGSTYKYGVVYHEGKFNDLRMNMDILLTGTLNEYNKGFKGGNILNYAEVVEILKDDFPKSTVKGVVFKDKINNDTTY